MPIVTPRTFRGTRDFLPGELLGRRRILSVIEEAYRRYGFQPLETPAIEYLDILTGKSEENDKLIYEIKRARGEETDTAETAIALRYDLTVPLARVVAQYADLPRPFKRYQIQPVWRADRPQPRQGRFREFVQCDADIVGTDSLLADAEIIALTSEILTSLLEPHDFRIRLSSRKLLAGLSLSITGDWKKFLPFCRVLDKIDKIGLDAVCQELAQMGFDEQEVKDHLSTFHMFLSYHDRPIFDDNMHKAIRNLFGNKNTALLYQMEAEDLIRNGIAEIQNLYESAAELGVDPSSIKCDPFLARGLDYYTGPIFETVLPDHPHIGSLSGGGRYDGLVQTFSKERVPATGTTIGLDRIQTALTQLGKFTMQPSLTQVLVARFDADDISRTLRIAADLREARVNTEIWYDVPDVVNFRKQLQKQLAYASRQGIPIVLWVGPDESSRGVVAIKNMKTGEQKDAPLLELVTAVRALLNE